MQNVATDTDILIVGAGPVGLFLANECPLSTCLRKEAFRTRHLRIAEALLLKELESVTLMIRSVVAMAYGAVSCSNSTTPPTFRPKQLRNSSLKHFGDIIERDWHGAR
jgi:hypothetical protein